MCCTSIYLAQSDHTAPARMAEMSPRTRSVHDMLKIGDHVRLHPKGKSVFSIVSIDNDRAVVESDDPAAGRYPFSCLTSTLVLHVPND